MDNEIKDRLDKIYDEVLNSDQMNQEELTKKADEFLEGIKKGDKTSDEVLESLIEDEVNNTEIPEVHPNPEELSPAEVMVSYDPLTGQQTIVDDKVSIKDITSKQLEAFNRTGDPTEINTNLLKSIFQSGELKDDSDATIMAQLMIRRMAGEKFNPYNEFPPSFKAMVDDVASHATNVSLKDLPGMKATVARSILDEVIKDYRKELSGGAMDLDTMLSGFDQDIEKINNEMGQEMGQLMLSLDQQRTQEIDAAIKRCEEEGKDEAKDKLLKMKAVLEEAYDLNKFAEACKSIKIKNGELKKPQQVFNSFNFKYEKHDNNINNIADCPILLERHLPKYNQTQKLALCMAFCKYCMNFTPDDIEEHTFMYYFIRNIVAADRLSGRGKLISAMDEPSKAFYDRFMKAVSNCIDNLTLRNPNLNTK